MMASKKTLLPLMIGLVLFVMLLTGALRLPVLADGTLHAYVMEHIAGEESLNIDAEVPYPPTYHLFGAIVYSLFGTTGIKLISPVMMALSGLLAYLIAKRLTEKEFIALASLVLVATSSKVILYGSQVLMEPFMCFFVLAAVYSVMLLFQKQDTKRLIFASLAMGLAIATKQQAVFLFMVAPVFLLVVGVGLRRCGVLVLLALLVAFGPYLYLFNSTGTLVGISTIGSISHPVHDSYVIHLEERGSPLDRLLFRVGEYDIPDWSRQLDEEADGLSLYEAGAERPESRHLYIWDMWNPIKFTDLNSLQSHLGIGLQWEDRDNAVAPFYFVGFMVLQLFLVLGFVVALVRSVKERDWRIVPTVVFFGWLLTFMGTDTRRYFLYLPIFLAFACPLLLPFVFRRFKSWRSKIPMVVLSALILLAVLCLCQDVVQMQSYVRGLEDTQCGKESQGGIASIEEVGDWLKAHTSEQDVVFGTSIYEWTYYSSREAFWDYRIYFLPPDRIDHYMRLWGVKYVLVRENQALGDEDWNYIEYYPLTFCSKVEDMYSLAYTSSYGDISVFEVK